MKKTIQLAILIAVVPCLMGLAFNAVNPRGIPLITPPPPKKEMTVALEQMVFIVSNNQLPVVDARHAAEYEDGHIPGAFSLPEDEFEQRFAEFNAWVTEGEKLVVYCQGGDCESSNNLAWKLKGRGYSEIMHYTGGFHEWEEAGQDVEYGPWKPPHGEAPLVQVDLDLMKLMLDDYAVAVDVRGSEAFAEGHIPGAVNLPAGGEYDPVEELDDEVYNDTELLLYGEAEDWDAANEVARVLRSAGYTSINFYPAGWPEWQGSGEEIETGGAQ